MEAPPVAMDDGT